jgi:threonine/homoserine/homoserine lactone efflux protein
MPHAPSLALFVASAIVVVVVPGPAVLYITARSVSQGRRAGLVSVLGIQSGTLVHVLAASLGLSAILLTSAVAFEVVRYLGAGYLIFLGIRRLLSRDDEPGRAAPAPERLSKIYRDGIVVNVLNPKTALFFFAFLPQFVDPSRGATAARFAALGLLFTAIALASDGAWALAASAVGEKLRASRTYRRRQRIVSGGVYIGLGLAAAAGGGRRR